MSPPTFDVSSTNQVRQVQQRGHYDHETVFKILDASLIGNVAFAGEDGMPFVIPMLFARQNDELLFHGSTKSRLMQQLGSGKTVCVSATLLDGLVMAKSLFHHSMNYRSVCVFGTGYEVTDEEQRIEALRIITDKTMLGRWDDARQPNAKELKATSIVAVKIETASAKIRTGPPKDDKEDINLPVWSGIIPMSVVAGTPVAADYDKSLTKPDYMQQWIASNS